MGSDDSDSDSDFEDTDDEDDWGDLRRRVKNQSPDTPTNQDTTEQSPHDQVKSNNIPISTPKKVERRVETSLPSPADIIDELGGISRKDQKQEKELEQIQNTHAIDFKGGPDYDSEDSEVYEADGCMGWGLGLILEGRSVENETKMVSEVEEARIRREEKEERVDPPPQFTDENIKSSLVEDKIDIVPPLTHKSDTDRKVNQMKRRKKKKMEI